MPLIVRFALTVVFRTHKILKVFEKGVPGTLFDNVYVDEVQDNLLIDTKGEQFRSGTFARPLTSDQLFVFSVHTQTGFSSPVIPLSPSRLEALSVSMPSKGSSIALRSVLKH